MAGEGAAGAEAEAEHRFPCDACGADLRFDAGADRLICDSCGATRALESTPAARRAATAEHDFEAALEAESEPLPEAGNRLVRCGNCGAEISFGESLQATECPFCASPLVIGTGARRRIKPAALIPFALDERAARRAMSDWLGRLWFAPNGLQRYARKGRPMQGVYVPCWTFDADTESRYRGQRGDAYYVTRTVTVRVNGKSRKQRRQVRKIRWRRVSGRVARFFDDILVPAADSLPRREADAIAPWDLDALMPYRPEYLAGFRAEGYTLPLEQGFAAARAIIERRIERDVRFDIGGDAQRIERIDTAIRDVTFKHVLLPVWLAAYSYRGKTYRIIVNGQSGAVGGARPWSRIKIALALLLGAALAAAIGYAVAQNG